MSIWEAVVQGDRPPVDEGQNMEFKKRSRYCQTWRDIFIVHTDEEDADAVL